MINLTKAEYIALIKTLELRSSTIAFEVMQENGFLQEDLTDAQHDYIMGFEALKGKIYVHAKDYGLEELFETREDTSYLSLKTDSELMDVIFKLEDVHEKAITYDTIVKHIIGRKAQQMKSDKSPDELQFSEFSPVIDALIEKNYNLLEKEGLDAVLKDGLENVDSKAVFKQVFAHFSHAAIKFGDAEFTEAQIKNGNIGNSPALEEDIEKAETRLGIKLPEDYKTLLQITNGFSAPSYTEPSFLSVEKIDYLRHIDTDSIEAYSIEGLEETGKTLERSILVGGLEEEQYFLLIPPQNDKENWQYWKFANWIPGEEPYHGIQDYFQGVIEFMLEGLEEKSQD